jgi:hypothetical protein
MDIIFKYKVHCINIVTCLTKGNDRIQDTVAPFLERQQVSWIRRCYATES